MEQVLEETGNPRSFNIDKPSVGPIPHCDHMSSTKPLVVKPEQLGSKIEKEALSPFAMDTLDEKSTGRDDDEGPPLPVVAVVESLGF